MIEESDILEASILIVDDQQANVSLLQRLLAQAGYTQVASTMSPREVCALHLKNRFDLILLDLQMPGFDGFEVMAALKLASGSGYVPVIVLTAHPAEKLRALQAGARDFVGKPFDLMEVKTRIRNLLEVRLLYRRVEGYNELLERTVRERTAELLASEYRFRRLTELASDWYWEQSESGEFTRVSGPVLDMLGLRMTSFLGDAGGAAEVGWNETERAELQALILSRQPFLDFAFSQVGVDGSERHFRVSGEPMLDEFCRYTGYRGIGVEIMTRLPRPALAS